MSMCSGLSDVSVSLTYQSFALKKGDYFNMSEVGLGILGPVTVTPHHQGSAGARDAVKKDARRKAGIGYHEVVAGHATPKELRVLVERLVPEI